MCRRVIMLRALLVMLVVNMSVASSQVCSVTSPDVSVDGTSSSSSSQSFILVSLTKPSSEYYDAVTAPSALLPYLSLPAAAKPDDYLDKDDTLNLLVNVCGTVGHPGCATDSAVCLLHNSNPALSLNLGTARYQPDYVGDKLSLTYPAGSLCRSFIVNETEWPHLLDVHYSTRINFVCSPESGIGLPAFQEFGHDNPCEVVLTWKSAMACSGAGASDGLPLWLRILLIIFLLVLSALFSGLTLGLLSLDLVQLEILIASGSDKEKMYARRIFPVRKHGNYLLCTLLLGNVIVNSSLSIIMADLTSGIVGLITSALGIVLFGEIIPQSICHKHGLAIGAYTVWLVKFFMVLTFPLSYPISKSLDFILGHELGTMFTRDALKELVNIQSKQGYFSNDERKLLSGALEFKNKAAVDIMTTIDKVFMISLSDNLDFDTIKRISENGHSRIPVYEENADHIVGLLLVRDLAFLNPEDGTPVRTILEYYGRQIKRVYFNTGLDELLREFREGHAHMAVVWQVDESVSGGDPVPRNLGIVTLEDVIEEIIQMEIDDETDAIDPKEMKQSYGLQSLRKKLAKEKALLPPQQKSAVASFLSGDLKEFSPTAVGAEPLAKLLDVSVLHEYEAMKEGDTTNRVIYEKGKHADHFTLVLQGKVSVTSGGDHFVSEVGPFQFMALKALTDDNYVTDFTATAKDFCQVLKIKKSSYTAAIKATEISMAKGTPATERVTRAPSVEDFEVEDEDQNKGLLSES